MEEYKVLIDSTEFQQKVLDYIGSDEFDKMVDATVFKCDNQCKLAIIHGMSVASMLTSQCEPFCIKSENDNKDLVYKLACLYMGKIELYDRSICKFKKSNDLYFNNVYLACYNRYAEQLYTEIVRDYDVEWKVIHTEIMKHIDYSGQKWVDEYKRLWVEK